MPNKDVINTDLTFFTNEKGKTLLDRFRITLENNTKFFDVLVGYFRTSGFYQLYKSLEKVEKIRILVGINVNQEAKELIDKAKSEQLSINLSYKEVKDKLSDDKETGEIEAERNEQFSRKEMGEIIKEVFEWNRMRSYHLNHDDTSNNMARSDEGNIFFSSFLEDYSMN